MLTWHMANDTDLDLLAEWNYQLIRDEGHRNPMTVLELRHRMAGWLGLGHDAPGEYTAVLFYTGDQPVAYALYREYSAQIYLRQFFVRRDQRRRGIGSRAFEILREIVWSPSKRLTVEVLVANTPALAFWRFMGYQDYSLMLEIPPSD